MATFSVKTRIVSGDGCLSWLGQLHDRKIWIVCDAFLADSDNLKLLLAQIDADNEVRLFSGVVPDPPIASVVDGINAMRQAMPQVVIGFGGGSALDAAKAIVFFGRRLGMEIDTFIAVPTTSGTGSEVTNASVISDPLVAVKYPLFDDSLYPDVALLEPALVLSVPPAVTANTGLDVLTHALEAYVATGATDFTDALAEKAVQLVFQYLEQAWRDGANRLAREKMHHASTLAGLAFSQAGLGLNHAIAHQLGGQLHIPHGLANALLLGGVIRFNSQDSRARAKYARLGKLCGLANYQSSDEHCVVGLINYIGWLMRQMRIVTSLQQVKIPRERTLGALEAMAAAALRDATLATNPRPATEREIKALISAIA